MSARSSLCHTARSAALIRPSPLHTSAASRALSTSRRMLAKKDTQDKESLKRASHEYTLTGSDEGAAENQQTAFGSRDTSPEEALSSAEQESKSRGQPNNALDVSPANAEVSKSSSQVPDHTAADAGLPKESSKGGTPTKAGQGRRYATESESNSPNAGSSGLNAGNKFALNDRK